MSAEAEPNVYDGPTTDTYLETFQVNPSRQYISRYLADFLHKQDNDGRLIDFGCGDGGDIHIARDAGWGYVDTDLSQDMLLAGQNNGVETTLVADLDNLPFSNDVFNSSVSLWALQYKENIEVTLTEWQRVLAPHSPLLLVVPHPVFKFVKYSQDYFIVSQQWEEGLGIERFKSYHPVQYPKT